MSNQRIYAIYHAAVDLFLKQGYSKTQISHIAKAAGVSVGTIYHDFTGKEEIMHFILKCTLEPDFMDREFERPITDELFCDLDHEIMEAFEKSQSEFAENIKNAGKSYSFESLISDTFDFLSRYAVGCLFIEKNQMDCGRLIKYYKEYRKRFFLTMTAYMNAFIEKGIVRPLEQPELTTSLIIEILSWWAMDMRYISFEAAEVPYEQAKAVCMDNIISAYKK